MSAVKHQMFAEYNNGNYVKNKIRGHKRTKHNVNGNQSFVIRHSF